MTSKSEQAKRYLELASNLEIEADCIAVRERVTDDDLADATEKREAASAIRRLAEIDSGSSIQNLIDELQEQLPGARLITLHIGGGYYDGSICVDYGTGVRVERFAKKRRGRCSCKTPDEALSLLRQRLGLEQP